MGRVALQGGPADGTVMDWRGGTQINISVAPPLPPISAAGPVALDAMIDVKVAVYRYQSVGVFQYVGTY